MVTIKQGCTLHVAHFHAYFNRPCLTIDIKLSNIIILLIRFDMDECVPLSVCVSVFDGISTLVCKRCACVSIDVHIGKLWLFDSQSNQIAYENYHFFAIITNEFFSLSSSSFEFVYNFPFEFFIRSACAITTLHSFHIANIKYANVLVAQNQINHQIFSNIQMGHV